MDHDLNRLTNGLPKTWTGFMRDWDRGLRAGGHPLTTRYNYLLAVSQLARFLQEEAAGPESDAAAADPAKVSRAHCESFQIWMIETRSASTALNKHKALQQFFRWLVVDEAELERSPMEHIRQPRVGQKLIPVLAEADTSALLTTCKGRTFIQQRDEAIIRLLANSGARLAEIAGLAVTDVNLDADTVQFHGKGNKERRVRFGPRTGRALSRYLRARDRHTGHDRPELWLADRGGAPLQANGIKLMIKRRARSIGMDGVHAHRWRHTFAHQWKRAGGDTGDLMLLLGWSSDDMPRRYGASAAAERAQETHQRLGIGDDV